MRCSFVPGGDECLALEFAPDTLREVTGQIDPRAAERDEFFRVASGRLGAAWILGKHRLASGLRKQEISALEADERALDLLAACAPASLAAAHTPGERAARMRAAVIAWKRPA